MDINKSSNKSFGIVFFIFFLIISIYPLFKNENIIIWSLIFSLIFLFLGLLNSRILTPLNILWFKFGILIGKLVSPIVMGIIFYGIVTPTSIIMKLFGKNLLDLKKSNKKSYWIEKSKVKKAYRDKAQGRDVKEYKYDYGTPESVKLMKKITPGQKEGTDAPKGPESYEAQYKRRLVKTTDPEHKAKGFKYRIKGKKDSSLTKKLYKKKPGQGEFNAQMKRIAGHEFG